MTATISCPSCGAIVATDARFCPACGTRQPERDGGAAREVRKVVTVLFADVTRSTALGERLDPKRCGR
jgi:class 3 adenylate cyclase